MGAHEEEIVRLNAVIRNMESAFQHERRMINHHCDKTIRGKETIRQKEKTIRKKMRQSEKDELENYVLYWKEGFKKVETLRLNQDRCFAMLMPNTLDPTQSQAGLRLPGIQTNAVSEDSQILIQDAVRDMQVTQSWKMTDIGQASPVKTRVRPTKSI